MNASAVISALDRILPVRGIGRVAAMLLAIPLSAGNALAATPVTPPTLVGPICTNQPVVEVVNATPNAPQFIIKNGAVVGAAEANSAYLAVPIKAPAVFAQNDAVFIAEYVNGAYVSSNTVYVGCQNVVTHHNDVGRTGWNSLENNLTPANVTASTFGLLASIALDAPVDAQPLVMTNQIISGQGIHSVVVYVATENNSIYAIDGISGQILSQVNLGAPVTTPLTCGSNGPPVGINSTPVIDPTTQTLYVMAWVLVGSNPTYMLHALNLETLADQPGSPSIASASEPLGNGVPDAFDPTAQHQRPALLESNGAIYVGFGSFCDGGATSRGWVLGWSASSLKPLTNAELVDQFPNPVVDCGYLANPPEPLYACYLSGLWMSGAGIAADSTGNLFFTTGNTAPYTYNGNFNLAESMVKLSADLSTVEDHFTPNDEFLLDLQDLDYGAGGVLVLPDQTGPTPHLAVAAGKEGTLFIVNRDTGKMGGMQTPNVPSSVIAGDCWCAPAYYVGSDGVPRVVTSGGPGTGGVVLGQWTVNTTNTPPLTLEAMAAALPASPEDPGAFTSISSNGTNPNTAIIWTVDRPDSNGNVTLYAHNATASGGVLAPLWSGAAGTWSLGRGDANIVPTVANGRVYVAGNQLSIFGLFPPGSNPTPTVLKTQALVASTPLTSAANAPVRQIPSTGPVYWGTVKGVVGSRLDLELRSGRILTVDISRVVPKATTDTQAVGRYFVFGGTLGHDGVLTAKTIWRVKGKEFWGADRDH